MNFSFFKKMTAFILLPVFIVLIVMTYFSYGKSEKTLSETIDSQLTSIVKIQSEAIYSNMLIYRALTEDLSKDDAITHFAEAYLDNNQEKLAYYKPIATERLKRLIDGFSGINQVVMLNTQGIAILDTLQKVNGRDFSKEEFVLGALNGAEGHKATATSSKKIDFVICYPLRGTDGTAVTGYIFTVINLDHIAKRTIDNINFSAGGTALVLDTHGTVIMHKDRNLVGENRADMQVFQQINRVKNGIMRYEDQGKSRVVYVYDLKWLNWYLAFPVWEDSLLAGVHELHDNSLVICGVSLVILLAIIVVFAKRISSALGGIDNIARKVAGGDMHLTDQENGLLQKLAGRRDEIGSLSDSFAKMIATLLHSVEEAKNAYKTGMNEAAEKLQGVVSATSSVTHELSAQIQESSNGADIQAQRISETVTSVEEMNATIFEVTKNTVTTAQIAGNTRERAEEGQSVVKELMQSIAKVEQSTNTLKYDMDELNKHVQDINKIMAVISDLADQTNLLALNAAIEAARAGEAGRGFAVVADEVRKLAEKTMASTSNVGNAVIAIKNSTSSSLEQVGVTVDLVTKAIELADQCRAALTEIVDMASDSAERIGSIAVASEEQSSASEEITKSISDINGVVVQTSTTMNEAKVAIIELSKQADILANMVHSMRS